MKKLTVFILLLAMVFSLMACGKTKEPVQPDTSDQKTEEKSSTQEVSEEPVVLTFTGWRVEDQGAIDEMNAEFNKEYPNIKVEYNPVKATEYDSYLQTALASDTAEDIIMMRSFGVGEVVFKGGNILSLTEENVPNLKKIPAEYKNAWTAEDGTIFALPGGMVIAGFHYNKKIFDECGITKVPETTAELFDICEKIKEKGYVPISNGIKDAWVTSEIITSSALPAFIDSDSWVRKLLNKETNFEDPKYIGMLKSVKDLSRYFPSGFEGIGYEDAQQMFLSEASAMFMSGSFEVYYFQSTNPDLDLGCFAYPGVDGPAKAVNIGLATGYGINKNTKNMDAALTYINWLGSKEACELFANGVVGFYGMNPEASTLTNEVSKSWLALTKDGEGIQMLGYEKLAAGQPDYTTAIADSVYQMLIKGKTPEEAAAYMQSQMEWYFK
jgi:raffinose/stachyose/melibiose transport system substrate-binding protein